jgi:peptide/nickel transport system permease protein
VIVLQEQLGIHVLYVQGKYTVGQEGDVVNLIEHMVLPVLVLMLTSVAAWSRYQRDSMSTCCTPITCGRREPRASRAAR